MIEIGKYTATILENSIATSNGGSTYVGLLVKIGEDMTDIKIYLTPKAIKSGFSQRQLLKCGFDCDKQNLADLEDNPKKLAGIEIPVTISENEYNGRTELQCSVNLGNTEKSEIQKLQDFLRKPRAKSKADEAEITDDDLPF